MSVYSEIEFQTVNSRMGRGVRKGVRSRVILPHVQVGYLPTVLIRKRGHQI